jgi:phenylalanyl-tRNA synthetase beta subunit
LTDQEINSTQERVVAELKQKLQAAVRDS